MLTLLVTLVILALVVWGAKVVIAAIGAPGWLLQIVTILAIIVAVILIANAFGIATPALK